MPPGSSPWNAAPPPVYVSPYGGPLPYRPARNPRQNAAIAAGVLVLIAGISALAFSNLILYWDALHTEWDDVTGGERWALEGGPFVAGLLMAVAAAVSLFSAYACFRHSRFILALAGPIAMLAGYFSMVMDDPIILIVGIHMLVLTVIALYLLLYSRPIFDDVGGTQEMGKAKTEGGAMPPGKTGRIG